MPICTFVYLYRDAGNYKGWGYLELVGEATAANEAAIREALIDHTWFDPEQVGVPPASHFARGPAGFDPGMDHAWHEFVRLEVNSTLQPGTRHPTLTIAELIDRLRRARG